MDLCRGAAAVSLQQRLAFEMLRLVRNHQILCCKDCRLEQLIWSRSEDCGQGSSLGQLSLKSRFPPPPGLLPSRALSMEHLDGPVAPLIHTPLGASSVFQRRTLCLSLVLGPKPDMSDHVCRTLPLFHCNGWCFPWTVALLAGTNVCLRKVRT
jgi:acyl-CoA synthetase (AMP-forming)/AMP-acid ligase II